MITHLKIDAFIFDMDGTLVDSMPYHEKAWDLMTPELGVSVDRFEFFTWSAGLTNKEIFPRLLKREVTSDELAQLAGRKEALYRDCYREAMQVMPGAIDLLTRARSQGVKTALGTAAPPENIELVIGGMNLYEHFPVIVGGADVRNGKPDPEIFLRCAEKMNVAVSHCVVFEDTPAGIEAAYRAGMRCVVITTTLTEAQVRALPNVSHVVGVARDFSSSEVTKLFAS
jgi:beta-phosphoglucomutase family hydrolase